MFMVRGKRVQGSIRGVYLKEVMFMSETVEKWSDARVLAHMRYVKNDELSIERWERSLREYKEGINRAESAIEVTTKSMRNTIHELSLQGVYL